MKEKSLKLIESAKVKKAEKEIKECTFAPSLESTARVNLNLISRSRAVNFNAFVILLLPILG